MNRSLGEDLRKLKLQNLKQLHNLKKIFFKILVQRFIILYHTA